MPVSPDSFKAAMKCFATGVTIVTTAHDGAIHGFTVNAFASVTANPPTVLVCVNKTARAHPLITESGGFCVNILGVDQRAIAEKFTTGEPQDRFSGLTHRVGPTGSPILDGVLAFVDCKVQEEITAGTHTIFIGAVLEAGDRPGAPLGYYDRAFRDFHLDGGPAGPGGPAGARGPAGPGGPAGP